MAISKVLGYGADWDLTKHTGNVRLALLSPTGEFTFPDFPIRNPAEFQALVSLLPDEDPIEFNDTGGLARVMVGRHDAGEPTGEEHEREPNQPPAG